MSKLKIFLTYTAHRAPYALLTIIVCNLVFGIWSFSYAAPIHPNAGKTSVAFLKIGMGSRAVGMGESFVAVADDIYSIYWNPAGLSQFSDTQITATHSEWFQNIRYEFIGYAQPLSFISNGMVRNSFGISVSGLYLNGLERRSGLIELPEDPPSLSEGAFGSYDIIGTLSYSHSLSENLFAGLNAKIIYEKIDTYDAYDIAFDIGCLYKLNDRLNIGFNIQNLGPKIKFIEEAYWLPMNIKFGFAYKIPEWGLITALSFDVPYDNYLYVKAGAEWTVFNIMSIRAGYRARWFGNELGDLAGLTAGAGFRLDAYQLDYAFVPYGDLGLTHRISFTVHFGESKKPETGLKNETKEINNKLTPDLINNELSEIQRLKEDLEKNKDKLTKEQIKERERIIKQKQERLEKLKK